jgi:hypothetical protein
MKAQNANSDNSAKPKEVDLLGEEGLESEEFDNRDFSARSLKTTAGVRQAITKKGGQPR